jgi:hypothetical protein
MLEYMEKYRSAPRHETCVTIDKPMLLFLGLAIADFISGVATFLAVVMFWDSGLAVFVAIFGGLGAAWGSREYRRRFPERFLQHWSWSMGLQRVRGVPSFFEKQRIRVFGP